MELYSLCISNPRGATCPVLAESWSGGMGGYMPPSGWGTGAGDTVAVIQKWNDNSFAYN